MFVLLKALFSMKLDWLLALIGRRVFSELHLFWIKKLLSSSCSNSGLRWKFFVSQLVTPAWTLIRRGEGHLGDNLGTHYTQYQGESPLLTVIQSPQGGVCRKGDKR